MKINAKRRLLRIIGIWLAFSLFIACGSYAVSAEELYEIPYNNISELKLIPGGVPFGVSLNSESVCVVSVGEVVCGGVVVTPARDAGIREKDIIVALNGQKVTGAAMVSDIIDSGGGSPVAVTVKRGENELVLTLTPAVSDDDGKYRAGLFIREGTAGIGTVTYIEPETGRFAGLGHGICDLDTGKLVPVTRGSVVNVQISSVVKGKSGSPGELQGYFSSGKIGTLLANRECGVYGVLCRYPDGIGNDVFQAASSDEVHDGDAVMICTADCGEKDSYSIKLSHIDTSKKNTKNFIVTVTDKRLIEKTGGIVQGMSGSPIIQNGRIVGAVTHVLVNDPTRGYGIFIENMLAEAEKIK